MRPISYLNPFSVYTNNIICENQNMFTAMYPTRSKLSEIQSIN